MSTYSIGKPLFVLEMRYAAEDWEQVGWLRYYDQAQLFQGAMQRSFKGWDFRLLELPAREGSA